MNNLSPTTFRTYQAVRALLPLWGALCFVIIAYLCYQGFKLGMTLPDYQLTLDAQHVNDYKDITLRTILANITVLMGCLLTASILCSTYTLFYWARQKTRNIRIVWLLVTAIAYSALLHYLISEPISGSISPRLYDAAHWFSYSQIYTELPINILIAYTMLAICLTVSSACALCNLSKHIEPTELAKISKLFHVNMRITAITLCASVIQAFSLYNWLVVFINESDQSTASTIVSSMTLSSSLFYTTLLVMVYGSAYSIIKSDSIYCAKRETRSHHDNEIYKFLTIHGIDFSLKKTLNLISFLFSPLILGILADVMRNIAPY